MWDSGAQLIFTLNLSQALLALLVLLLLRKFYKNYQNRYFQYWSWSWLGLTLYMIFSAIALRNIFIYEASHPFRIATSVATLSASLFQTMWLLLGSIELSSRTEITKKGVWVLSVLILPFSFVMVLLYSGDPEAANERGFIRIGIKCLIAGFAFIISSLLILRIKNSGVGIKFISAAFFIYGLEQFNYFLSRLFALLNVDYALSVPYYFGIVDLLLQALMGIGMIISVLEMEQQRLKKANSELDQFLYKASHDLRAPLTTIASITFIIREVTDRKELDRFIDMIELKVQQADKVIKDIITIRKDQKTGIIRREVNIKDLVHTSFETLTDPSFNTVNLVYESDADIVLTDPDRLQVAISSILANAITYHDTKKEKPEIKVSVTHRGNRVQISVTDNGLGIDKKYLPKIFDMFYRASQASQGSGLGLYMTRDALEDIGGSIDVESQPGIGTTFKIDLKTI